MSTWSKTDDSGSKVYVDNVLREVWNAVARMVTFYDATGALVPSTIPSPNPRPYTADENVRADSAVLTRKAAEVAKATTALTEATLALAPTPTTGGAWVQPTGTHNAYALGSKVSHAGKNWESLTPFNVWTPGVSGWREVVTQGYPAWVQPTGTQDAYLLNAIVTYNGQNWKNTGSNANVWVPGVFGWVVV